MRRKKEIESDEKPENWRVVLQRLYDQLKQIKSEDCKDTLISNCNAKEQKYRKNTENVIQK